MGGWWFPSRKNDSDFTIANAPRDNRSYIGFFKTRKYLIAAHLNRKKYAEFLALIKNPNLRCIDCDLKYNMNLTQECPLCHSDRAHPLVYEDQSLSFRTWLYWAISMAICFWFALWFLPNH